MAVGDAVGAVSAINTLLTFQPAAGVECMVSIVCSANQNNTVVNVTDGANSSAYSSTDAKTTRDLGNIKLFVTNSLYITLNALPGASTAFTGIQIK